MKAIAWLRAFQKQDLVLSCGLAHFRGLLDLEGLDTQAHHHLAERSPWTYQKISKASYWVKYGVAITVHHVIILDSQYYIYLLYRIQGSSRGPGLDMWDFFKEK